MTDAEIARRLTRIHRTLELIAFLLAALVVAVGGGIGFVVGGSVILLLAVEAIFRVLD